MIGASLKDDFINDMVQSLVLFGVRGFFILKKLDIPLILFHELLVKLFNIRCIRGLVNFMLQGLYFFFYRFTTGFVFGEGINTRFIRFSDAFQPCLQPINLFDDVL